MEILYLIPARAGSKGLPKKNTKILNGTPMIGYTIKSAFNANFKGRVIVSTDDEEASNYCKKLGAEVIFRPKALALDDTPTIDVVLHCLDELAKTDYYPDILVLLQPTSPLRNSEDIDNALQKYLDSKVNSCVSVCESAHPAEWFLSLNEAQILSPLFGWDKFGTRRQALRKTYYPNGAIYVINVTILKREKKFFLPESTIAYIMPIERSIDVDYEIDFVLAGLFLRENDENQNWE